MTNYREYFNTSVSAKALATADSAGNPDVCFCGTAFMPDEKTIAAAFGFFNRADKNISETRKAVFMAFRPTNPEYWKHYDETGRQLFPAGIRFHCTLKEKTDAHPYLEIIKNRFRKRIGNRIPDGLKGLFIFDVVEVRDHVF
jgi:hypothetical protein